MQLHVCTMQHVQDQCNELYPTQFHGPPRASECKLWEDQHQSCSISACCQNTKIRHVTSKLLTNDDGDSRLLANDLLTTLDLKIQCHHVSTNVLINIYTKYRHTNAHGKVLGSAGWTASNVKYHQRQAASLKTQLNSESDTLS